jgi:hypothetical protein
MLITSKPHELSITVKQALKQRQEAELRQKITNAINLAAANDVPGHKIVGGQLYLLDNVSTHRNPINRVYTYKKAV